ncbi:MAG: hypothetical protein J6T84_07780 [Spirochaetaceae bacterium]|nr:hypothetical protein [Spirochaetaceae bacterium]
MNLCTTDNNCGVAFTSLVSETEHVRQSDYQNLNKIASTTVEELTKNNPSLLIFPQVLGAHDDGIDEQIIFNLHGNSEQLEKVTLTTGNLMGFIGIGDTHLKIASRFSKADKHDFFMHYMLQKVFSINLFDWEHQDSDGELDLLMYAFPKLLKKALSQGLFKQYQTFYRNDANVKGVIDVSRHIRQNMPFGGNISYNSRERTFDNAVTELIRHTIEYIKTKPFGKELLNSSNETKKCVQEILEATQSYNLQSREKVIAQNIKPITHPYYTAYKPLQKLCLSILRHKKIGFGNAKNKVYGILFDGAWLWEEYLATVLVPAGFKHPRNKTGTGAISVYERNPRYPDFYKGKQIFQNATEQQVEGNFVLDAKYKHLANHKPDSDEITGYFSRDDLHQLITYMYIMPAKKAGLIYPYDKDDKRNEKMLIKSKSKTVYGYGGTVATYGVPIPVENNYKAFTNSMKAIEKVFPKFL